MKKIETSELPLEDIKWVLGKLSVEAQSEKLSLAPRGYFEVRPEGGLPDLEALVGLPIGFVSVRGLISDTFWRPDWLSESIRKAHKHLPLGGVFELSRLASSEAGEPWVLTLGAWSRGPFVAWSSSWRGLGRVREKFQEAIDLLQLPIEQAGRSLVHRDDDVLEISSLDHDCTDGEIRCAIQGDDIAHWFERSSRLAWSESTCRVSTLGPPGLDDPSAVGIWNAARKSLPDLIKHEHSVSFLLEDFASLEPIRLSPIPILGTVEAGWFRFEGGARVEVWIQLESGTQGYRLRFDAPDPEDVEELESTLEGIEFVQVGGADD